MLKRYLIADVVEAGCDEAGRGCLAGPVTAAAVILPPDLELPELNDSKQLSEKQRDRLRPIIEQHAVAWAVAMVSPAEIDRINILRASIRAMHLALGQLSITPQHIIVDGNKFSPYADIPHTTVVKGDSKYMSIAAASILAKTHRDQLMMQLHNQYPQYGWNKNKGYPTPAHKLAIMEHGISEHHRRSYGPCQPTLF